jgi:hypothetical protein
MDRSSTREDVLFIRQNTGRNCSRQAIRRHHNQRAETTSRVAEQFGLSLARVSQLRQELKAAWEVFQGEPSTGVAAGAA